jgi:alkenylglycerophosphocholine/alkenylglycerophosphoethanolamine hydrolase
MTKLQLNLFLIFACAFIATTFFKPYPLSWALKLFPILVLIHFSWQQLFFTQETTHKLFIAGLIFSGFGDFFLDYDRVNWFVFGLSSFLIAHLFYLFSLKPLVLKRMPIVVLYCLYGLGMFSLIYAGLGELFIPVLIYMTVLLLMGIVTLLSKKSNTWLIIGGISFIISDSLIGLDKFYLEIPYASFWIMITYYFAQFSLVKGMFEQKQSLA